MPKGGGGQEKNQKFTSLCTPGGRCENFCRKTEKMVDKRPAGVYNIPCQQRTARLTQPNIGDLHSGSAVDSDSTCGSSILSSPTRPQPVGLRYFRGIAQLVARLVRDEEAVGSNPAAPT